MWQCHFKKKVYFCLLRVHEFEVASDLAYTFQLKCFSGKCCQLFLRDSLIDDNFEIKIDYVGNVLNN